MGVTLSKEKAMGERGYATIGGQATTTHDLPTTVNASQHLANYNDPEDFKKLQAGIVYTEQGLQSKK